MFKTRPQTFFHVLTAFTIVALRRQACKTRVLCQFVSYRRQKRPPATVFWTVYQRRYHLDQLELSNREDSDFKWYGVNIVGVYLPVVRNGNFHKSDFQIKTLSVKRYSCRRGNKSPKDACLRSQLGQHYRPKSPRNLFCLAAQSYLELLPPNFDDVSVFQNFNFLIIYTPKNIFTFFVIFYFSVK